MGKPAVSDMLAKAQWLAKEARALADSIQLRAVPDRKVTIKQLIDSEIADFAATLDTPGGCNTPQEIQAELLKRFDSISTYADLCIAALDEERTFLAFLKRRLNRAESASDAPHYETKNYD